MKKRYLILALIILSICSIFIGVKDISFIDIFNSDDVKLKVLLISRIPRLISIIVVGVSMSIAGLIMQQISRNKFVSPDTASTIDSAKLGVLVALMIFPSATLTEKMIVSFIFSLLGTFLFMKILKKIKVKNSIFIPLVGIMLGNIIDSITTFFAYKYDLIQSIASWLQGDFSLIIKGNYELIYFSLPLVVIAFIYANKFTVAGMGEDFSKNLGVNYNRIINIGLVIVALISSLVVITVGKIPFLGLIVPNIVTLYKGDNLKNSLCSTALLGAVFLLGCDILGRLVIYPYEISIGLVVGVIGSMVFLYLLFRRNGNEV
ncbi:ABC transporter permease [Clostridium botulinum]|uniref:Ferric siderophore ABC transporter, permease protein n=4 Tax=Clostridium botulinum TaxID=1491 RepID=A5I0N7_CLOBH|nr:ABC transporter permease [Clostridium botulinum]ABS32594.1 iron chelate uptake ABC transporter, FeCT family, permease protein [Clostridium botulinum A str. ATCC 19397]ABS38803.1 iron chelate uptake ABC transporter, FeCT family, permease protein [Clostridium botulinum A str. Hall]ABS40417.1 iron chelate uptake ABC transporter, FeCT family, permease protein [Clostridium botulinum F str. Langeland]ADF98867.1 iron chelate uptake ABC transporter, FeCT family, permease protein [Clostridium botulin